MCAAVAPVSLRHAHVVLFKYTDPYYQYQQYISVTNTWPIGSCSSMYYIFLAAVAILIPQKMLEYLH